MTTEKGKFFSMMEGLKLETNREGPLVVIKMIGASNPSRMRELDSLFTELLDDHVGYFVLDLSETRMINSHQIGAIVRLAQNIMKKEQGGFAFVNPSDRIRYLLEMTCATDLAQIYDTVEEAIQTIYPSS